MSSTSQIKQLDVAVAGGTLATFRFGAPAKGAPAVLAIHGITASSYEWLALARASAGRATIFAPDLRGRGASNGLPGPYGIQAHVADLTAVLDQLQLGSPAVVVGHSLGAYITARLAADHQDRIRAVVLVDGGLMIPGIDRVEPQVFVDAFLGPALARLKMTFSSPEAYHDWWRAHPAIKGSDIADADLVAYADHDLVGREPELRSSVAEQAVRGDASDFLEMASAADRLTMPSTLLCAPRGLLGEPNPMQPLALVEAWAERAPQQRVAIQVPEVNHYSIVMGRTGAAAVAAAVAAALAR
jgi:lipase